MGDFFTFQYDLKHPAAYEYLSWKHIGSLIVLAILMLLLGLLFRRFEKNGRRRFLHGIPIFMVCSEVFKQIVLMTEHHASVGMLPLHLCGLGAYVFLLAEFLPSDPAFWTQSNSQPTLITNGSTQKRNPTILNHGETKRTPKSVLGEISFILIMPGAICALLMPDWTMYPLWNYFSIHGYLWHGLLVLYPCLLLYDHEIAPRISHLWYEALFLAVVVPLIELFNIYHDTNYLFIHWPPADTPLAWLASFMGNPGYLIGYAILAVLVMCLVYIPFEISHLRLRKNTHDDTMQL